MVRSYSIRLLAGLTPWIESELRGLRQLVRPGDVCIDVGAAAGLYTAELAHLVGSEGRVHSVEPLDFLYSAGKVLGLRRGGNVQCHPVALGETAGQHLLSVPLRGSRPVVGRSFLSLGATGLGSNAEFPEHMMVPVTTETLTSFIRRVAATRVDLIKADVEGAELAVLQGGSEVLAEYGPRLLLEVEQRHLARYGNRADAVVSWLAERGYRLFVWRRGAWREVSQVTAEHRNYLCSIDDPAGDQPVTSAQAWARASASLIQGLFRRT